MAAGDQDIYLITGGHGFIGSHVARRLFEEKAARIRIVDIAPHPLLDATICHDFIRGNLCDPNVCRIAVRGVHTVLHFAANMGGMGTIHEGNDFVLYQENHDITARLLEASLAAGVKRFFYASSACVYPEALQKETTGDISLHENDIWEHLPPQPQGLYGLEKFNSELLVQKFASQMDVRIARFHNVYGPGGAWNNGREKAPAAVLRKAVALKKLNTEDSVFEIWGNGTQRRSFLFVDDAVDGVIKLLESRYKTPFNIGSDSPVTIRGLADIALRSIDVDPCSVTFSYDTSKPLGVASRNSNNKQAETLLGWKPTVLLVEGLRRTGLWIEAQILQATDQAPDKPAILREMLFSQIIDLRSERIIFAILLPITSRGSSDPTDCLTNLRRFAASLTSTTWKDTHSRSSAIQYHFVVYLAIDADDDFLLVNEGGHNRAEQVLYEEGIFDIVSIRCSHPRGHVCNHWRDCARQAWRDGCDYLVLMGDDVVLEDEGWMRDADAEFNRLTKKFDVPKGFGCVAFTDTSFPGMPTFPIIHRTHMDIFNGQVVPDIFINQDGDPFLFQLYRRWGCSKMFSSRISNGVGGEAEARYTKKRAEDWTFDTLDNAVSVVEEWLQTHQYKIEKHVALDVVVPCYRVDLSILDTILGLKSSATCTAMFIVIVDNPSSPNLYELRNKYAHRADIRIRGNAKNLGASASRNRGMEESAAEWVHFLDDDVLPQHDILIHAEKVIRADPKAAGFVGKSVFPCADSIFTTAVHLAGVTYFWDIATKIKDDIPWGVTANLIARRGGEDIHFCREKREFSLQNGGEGFVAAPEVIVTHPWWGGGSRSYWRFHNWSIGDGALIKNFPEHTYRDWAPNSAELLLLSSLSVIAAIAIGNSDLFCCSLRAFVAVVLANIAHDCYRHLYRHPERNTGLNSSINGIYSLWLFAVI
ncbi:NAD-dependent epimerase/dehydratase [Flammula alnicola]|nr:NAD-dependent epimerase/dehydratase [Flammula alnicola]